MKFCFDLDDVIADTYPQLLAAAIKFDRKNLMHSSAQTDYSLTMAHGDYFWFAKILKWSEKNLYDFFQTTYPYFLENCQAYDGSKECLNILRRKKHEIIILSSREYRNYYDVEQLTSDWLSRNDIPYDKLVIGVKNKLTYLSENPVDIFVDDLTDNCLIALKANVPHVFRFVCEYNSNEKGNIMPRIADINDLRFLLTHLNI